MPAAAVRGAGKLIAVEGIDGAGKTTLCDELSARLRAEGLATISLQRFMIAELTALWRRLLEGGDVNHDAAAMLAAADYHAGAARMLGPALAAGHTVVMDRYVYSHVVHHLLRGVPRAHLEALFEGFREPDLVLHLKLAPRAALARQRAPGKPDFWECGLDAGVRGSIGAAYRVSLAHPPPRGEVERRFLDHQARAAALFDEVLPPSITVTLDATQPGQAVADAAWLAAAAVVAHQHVAVDHA